MVVQTVIQMRLKPFRKVFINILVTRSDLQQLAHSNTASKEGEGRGGGSGEQVRGYQLPVLPPPPLPTLRLVTRCSSRATSLLRD